MTMGMWEHEKTEHTAINSGIVNTRFGSKGMSCDLNLYQGARSTHETSAATNY